MNFFQGKKLILVGIIVVLLAAIPLTVYFLQQSQDTRSQAQKATTLYFALPDQMTEQTAPILKNNGDTFTVDVIANPGTNFISFAKLNISYDATKIATEGAGIEPITTGAQGLPAILEGPTFQQGTMSITLSVGADATKVIQQPTKIAKLTFKAISPTGSTPTQIKFIDGQTQILSNNCDPNNPQNCQDSASENVLSSTRPVSITIASATGVTPSISPATTPAVTPSNGPSLTPSPGISPVTSLTPTTPPAANTNPICSSLTLDRAPSGAAPFTVSFTANGTDADGTINKVTFNFGDGPIQDMTQSGGIGTKTVSAQVSHTYTNAGTYQASAILTDNQGGVSGNTCTQTITVTAKVASAGSGGTGGTGGTAPTTNPNAGLKPTMAPPGPGDTILQVGLLGTILSIIGALTFFTL